LKNPAASPESNCHGKVPAQGCNLTRDMIPRQEPEGISAPFSNHPIFHSHTKITTPQFFPIPRSHFHTSGPHIPGATTFPTRTPPGTESVPSVPSAVLANAETNLCGLPSSLGCLATFPPASSIGLLCIPITPQIAALTTVAPKPQPIHLSIFQFTDYSYHLLIWSHYRLFKSSHHPSHFPSLIAAEPTHTAQPTPRRSWTRRKGRKKGRKRRKRGERWARPRGPPGKEWRRPLGPSPREDGRGGGLAPVGRPGNDGGGPRR